MPTYEYECQGCGHKFELFQKITAAPSKECPRCHKDTARRLISAGIGLIFKGSGFYATDYKKSSRNNGEEKTAPRCDVNAKGPACSSCPAAKSKSD